MGFWGRRCSALAAKAPSPLWPSHPGSFSGLRLAEQLGRREDEAKIRHGLGLSLWASGNLEESQHQVYIYIYLYPVVCPGLGVCVLRALGVIPVLGEELSGAPWGGWLVHRANSGPRVLLLHPVTSPLPGMLRSRGAELPCLRVCEPWMLLSQPLLCAVSVRSHRCCFPSQLYRASALFETIRHEVQLSTDYKLSLFDLQTSSYQALQRVLVSLGKRSHHTLSLNSKFVPRVQLKLRGCSSCGISFPPHLSGAAQYLFDRTEITVSCFGFQAPFDLLSCFLHSFPFLWLVPHIVLLSVAKGICGIVF